jgi:hypothetical protein
MAEIPLMPDIRAPLDVVRARRLVIRGARVSGGSEEQTRGQSSAQQLLLHKKTPGRYMGTTAAKPLGLR